MPRLRPGRWAAVLPMHPDRARGFVSPGSSAAGTVAGLQEQLSLDLGAGSHAQGPGPWQFRCGARVLRVSECFDAYWRFAAERQRIFRGRAEGMPPPWTSVPILSRHKFTNVYRAADRVSQYLIRDAIYAGSQETAELV